MQLKLLQSQKMEFTVSQELRDRCNAMLTKPELRFLPSVLKGQIEGAENEARNEAFGKEAAAFMAKQINRMVGEYGKQHCAGKTILYYGYGYGDDNGWILNAIRHSIYVEIRDAGDEACRNAEAYAASFRKLFTSQFVPEIYLDDIANFHKLHHHEAILVVYACRILGLVDQPYKLLVKLGKGLFRRDEPGELVGVQSFDEDNSIVNCCNMTPLNKKQMMASLEKGAGRPLCLIEEEPISYYHKLSTPFVVKAL